jgi:ring-1,2-phenylacetyl-CoA epoxidase subunit PaaD
VVDRDDVLSWLHEVKDPEVPVISVVELGVVRDVAIDGESVTVEITPTYSGCPAMKVMEDEIVAALRSHGVKDPKVRTVFKEAWTTDWMSPAGREKLRGYGIAPPGHLAADGEGFVALRRATSVACPRCGSHQTKLQSEFGSTACKAIYTCSACREPFDYFKAI